MRRPLLWLALAVAYLCVTYAAIAAPRTAMQSFVPPAPIDLLAFYCAGKTAAHGADPYLAEPLRACEHLAFARATGHASRYPDLVVPAPLPPYVLLLLEPFGALPFEVARAIFCAAVVAASFALVAALGALARAYYVAFAVGVGASVLIPALQLGQIASLAIVALALSAWALRSGRIVTGSCLAALTLIEPHLGVPVVLGLFACVPRSRRTLGLCVAAVAAVTLLAGGIERNLEYAARVVPAQAAAEGTEFLGQYSLAAVLAQLGVPERAALSLGSLSYLAMVALGVVTAVMLARKSGDAAFAPAVGPAFALLGGTYVHIHNVAAALPLAAILLGATQRKLVPALALLGLMVPWDIIEKTGVLPWFAAIPPHDAHAALAAVSGADRLAEDVWGVWIRSGANGNWPTADLVLFKLPTWLSLIALCWLALRLATGPSAPQPRAAPSLLEPL